MTGICCVREVMGMPITVEVREVAPDPEAVEVVYEDLALVDRTFSPFLPQSEVRAGRCAPALTSRVCEMTSARR